METLKILIPVDFSPTFQYAAAMAELIRNSRPVELYLLHVVPATGNAEDLEDAGKAVYKQIEAAHKWFAALPAKFNFKSFVKVGPVTETINQFTIEIGADLVIMGTKGADGLLEFISGSEAQHVARNSSMPVLTVQGSYLPARFQHILLVSDFEEAMPVLPLALIKALVAPGGTIHLLHILKPHEFSQAESIIEKMQVFAKQNQLENMELHLHQEHKVDQGVYQFNKDHQMDLVCLGTHARKGLNHLLHGSIAERLINHCSKPVLTYHL
ncbi:universal stress protein [Adhaeribacter aquaticus]|uniref:universal stress protein n=1 Tax=Adhaeribacter aquaticus TaxID=299567 RepID=UPI00041C7553|nr:universal stress protein [Adhaeribacter aquaticus]